MVTPRPWPHSKQQSTASINHINAIVSDDYDTTIVDPFLLCVFFPHFGKLTVNTDRGGTQTTIGGVFACFLLSALFARFFRLVGRGFR